jgi:SAM-dependent methyltransferase
LSYPDVSEVLRGETLLKEDDTWIRLIHEKQHLIDCLVHMPYPLGFYGSTILEIGCGTGLYAGMLADRYPNSEYTGIDANPEALAIARRRNPDLRFEEKDFRDVIPLRLKYDLVCAHAFLKHFDYETWLDLFPKFLSLGRVAQFDMQIAAETINDGSPSFGNNLWVKREVFDLALAAAGHTILSEEIAYEHNDRRATIFLTSSIHR